VEHIADRVAVMYLGKIVEIGSAQRIWSDPAHPYTRALLSAVPGIDPSRRGKRVMLCGEMPSPASPPPGCAFHPRCPLRIEICTRQEPSLESDDLDHVVACHRKEI